MTPTGYFLDHLWLIPLFPLATAALMLFFGRRLPNTGVSVLCVGSVGLSFLYALGAVFQLLAADPEHRVFQKVLFEWLTPGPMQMTGGHAIRFVADWGYLLDPLSCVMVLVVTGVGFLIHVYSIGYMGHEGGYYRFFGYMNLFMFAMLTLVLANNMLLMFVGWEGVGLCSYLLIGFYFLKKSASDAGKKAFIVNRIGDAGFILGILLTAVTLGTIRFTSQSLPDSAAYSGILESLKAAMENGALATGAPVLTAIALLLFIGAIGKSAQIPLYVWLPDAMEGPTPVSALIHAATMVTAGVYMVARCHVLFELAPAALETVAVIGAATALFAATIGLAQNDIKRVLAYSTISQLGYMFFACGVGAFSAGIFHLMTHAFFKALLFLGAGSVIHALSGEQDMRRMGGLSTSLPWTHGTMLVATLAIAGIPPFAGFFSKDEILSRAFASGHSGVWLVGLVGAALTAFYMFRLYILAFRGPSRLSHEAEHHLHESPPSMIIPLVVLAALSAVGGLVGQPMQEGGHLFERWMRPVFEGAGGEAATPLSPRTEWTLIALSVAAAALGIYGAYRTYLVEPGLAARLRERLRAFHQAVLHKYWIDELYDALVVAPVYHLSQRLWRFWDERIVDGMVNGVAYTFEGVSALLRLFQTGFVGTYALFFTLGVLVILIELGR